MNLSKIDFIDFKIKKIGVNKINSLIFDYLENICTFANPWR